MSPRELSWKLQLTPAIAIAMIGGAGSFIALVWRVSAEGQKTRDEFSNRISLIVAQAEADKNLKAAKDAEQDRRLDANDDNWRDFGRAKTANSSIFKK